MPISVCFTSDVFVRAWGPMVWTQLWTLQKIGVFGSIWKNVGKWRWAMIWFSSFWRISQNGGTPSHHGFQYWVMVTHDLDDLGYPYDLGNLHITHYELLLSLIFKRALISGCLLVRICFWQIERIFPSRAEFCQTSTSWVLTACRWFKKKQAAQRAQFPANEHTFEKWLFSNLTVPRAEIGKTSRFGFLEQKFARAEISVLLKLQDHYEPLLTIIIITINNHD